MKECNAQRAERLTPRSAALRSSAPPMLRYSDHRENVHAPSRSPLTREQPRRSRGARRRESRRPQRSSELVKNGFDIVEDLLRLLLDRLADDPSSGRIKRELAGDEDQVAETYGLRIGRSAKRCLRLVCANHGPLRYLFLLCWRSPHTEPAGRGSCAHSERPCPAATRPTIRYPRPRGPGRPVRRTPALTGARRPGARPC